MSRATSAVPTVEEEEADEADEGLKEAETEDGRVIETMNWHGRQKAYIKLTRWELGHDLNVSI